MTFEEILSQLKNKVYQPIYFLMGEEPYFIDIISDYIADNVLDESEKSFNQTTFYGKDSDINTIINTARRFPMMASYQVVVVKEAQLLKDLDNLIYYIEKPLSSTILVISYKYGMLDKRKKLYTSLTKNALVFESPKLYEDQIPSWIGAYVKARKCTIETPAALMMVEFLGDDLSKIANELDKLIITLPVENRTITPSHIEKNIGISKDYNNFELQKALIHKDILKANRIVNYFGQNQNLNPITLTLSILFSFFSKLLLYHTLADKSQKNAATALKIRPFFVKDYELASKRYPLKKTMEVISNLREYDLKSKGVNNTSTPAGELLKELVYKILH
jgi:DNA polymerase III subunit delta